MKKMIVPAIVLTLLTFMIMAGCTVLTPSGQGYNSYDQGSSGGHSHH